MFIKPLAALIAASVMLTPLTTFSATPSSTEKASKAAVKAAKSSSKSSSKTAKKPAAPQEVAELELAHGLDEAAAQALQSLVDEFNARRHGRSRRSC
jgi:sn-glycerol 3-phosphate transport system substrate-binding protein